MWEESQDVSQKDRERNRGIRSNVWIHCLKASNADILMHHL
jgi:hypothetical protein